MTTPQPTPQHILDAMTAIQRHMKNNGYVQMILGVNGGAAFLPHDIVQRLNGYYRLNTQLQEENYNLKAELNNRQHPIIIAGPGVFKIVDLDTPTAAPPTDTTYSCAVCQSQYPASMYACPSCGSRVIMAQLAADSQGGC